LRITKKIEKVLALASLGFQVLSALPRGLLEIRSRLFIYDLSNAP